MNLRGLFETADIERLRALGEQRILRRVLSGRDVLSIGLGGMIGSGIFTTIGPGVKMAGPAIILSYILAAVASFFAALSYAEFASLVPISGSAYTYAYATLGKLVAWIVGFALIFGYGITVAPLSQQLSAALQDMYLQVTHQAVPFWMERSHLALTGPWWNPSSWDVAHSQYDVIAAIFVLVLTALLVAGIRETATTNNIFNVLKFGALFVFIVGGLALVHPSYLTPFAPNGWGALRPFSGGAGMGIIPGAALVFFNYLGFESPAVVSEECRNPKRDLPLGIIGTLLIGTLLYCAVAIVLVAITPWQSVDETHALARAIAPLHNPLVNWIILVGIFAGTTTAAINGILGQSRIFFVMARDHMLPPSLATVHAKYRTPVRMTLFVGSLIAVLALIVPIENLINLSNIGMLLAYSVVCAGVIYLRRRRPDLPRTFRSPFVPLFPALGILCCAFLAVYGLDAATWSWFIGALVGGLIFFFLYGARMSRPAHLD